MNEFTKEELEKILYVFNDWDSPMRHESEWMSVKNKIFDMIENYCEHDCKATIWQCQVTACSKCGFPSTITKVKNDNQ